MLLEEVVPMLEVVMHEEADDLVEVLGAQILEVEGSCEEEIVTKV